MATEFNITVKHAAWMDKFPEVVKQALTNAGGAFQAEMKIYPPQSEVAPGTKYVRKKEAGGLAGEANYQVQPNVVQFTDLYYGPWVLGGNRWWAGWPGKKEAIKTRAIAAFKAGLKEHMR